MINLDDQPLDDPMRAYCIEMARRYAGAIERSVVACEDPAILTRIDPDGETTIIVDRACIDAPSSCRIYL